MMHNAPLDKVDPASLLPPLNRMALGFFETNVNGRESSGTWATPSSSTPRCICS